MKGSYSQGIVIDLNPDEVRFLKFIIPQLKNSFSAMGDNELAQRGNMFCDSLYFKIMKNETASSIGGMYQ